VRRPRPVPAQAAQHGAPRFQPPPPPHTPSSQPRPVPHEGQTTVCTNMQSHSVQKPLRRALSSRL
jgi:hypothetical protein